MSVRSLLIIALTFVSPVLWSTTASANMADVMACSNISDNAARLACFDTAVASTPAESAIVDDAQQVDLGSEEDQRSFFGLPRFSMPNILRRGETSEEEFGSTEMEQERAREEHASRQRDEEQAQGIVNEINATVVEWGINGTNHYFIVLENGHVWRQTETGRMAFRNNGENVVRIRRGRFGGFRMKVNDANRNHDVERIR